MPNIHYYVADLSKLQLPNQGEVRFPVASPISSPDSIVWRILKWEGFIFALYPGAVDGGLCVLDSRKSDITIVIRIRVTVGCLFSV